MTTHYDKDNAFGEIWLEAKPHTPEGKAEAEKPQVSRPTAAGDLSYKKQRQIPRHHPQKARLGSG